MKDNVIGVIPARMASSRLPGKPMQKIHGMPMVGHCYYRTSIALGIDKTYVATCDEDIFNYIESIGGNVVMTSLKHTRATTRTSEALEIIEKKLNKRMDLIVMVQGDEPLILPETITESILKLEEPEVEVVNIMSRIATKEAFEDKNNVKVVVDTNYNALYFSREAIPSPWKGWEHIPRYMQTGVIAFYRDALLRFNIMDETKLEQIESVDMNRILESGGKIRMVLTNSRTVGVDVPEEIFVAESLLKNDPIMLKYL